MSGLFTLGGALAGPQSGAAPRSVDVDGFLDKMVAVIDARQSEFETASILNAMPVNEKKVLVAGDLRTRCYFDFGDVSRFRQLVAKGLKGVVVDPTYMNESGHGKAKAVYQNQGTWAVAVTSYEGKYEGFIILRSYSASPGKTEDANDTDQLHESVHALAAGIERTDLDEDVRGKAAPEYITGAFFKEQKTLARLEHKALTETLAAVNRLVSELKSLDDDTPKSVERAMVRSHLGQIHEIGKQYLHNVKQYHEQTLKLSTHSWEMVRELMGIWGGKADWDRLISDSERNVAVLGELVSDVAQGGTARELNPDFVHFFFEKQCIAP